MRAALTFETPGDAAVLRRLEPLAHRIFGGERRADWWARKLERENAEPGLSVLVRHGSGEIVGYGLAGRPAPGATTGAAIRAVTMGVEASARGRGIGTAIWRELLDRARMARATSFELSAQHGSVSFYERLGFETLGSYCTWSRAPARADAGSDVAGSDVAALVLRFDGGGPWAVPGTVVAQWFERGWQGTPAHERARLRLPGACALISREPAGLLVQRLALTEDPDAALAALARVDPGSHLFVYGVDDEAPRTGLVRERLAAHGFVRAQPFFRMMCAFAAGS